MGRLTLNVLLSFAQFEREVIGERVRDKIAASKRKGIWVGGSVPLGYAAMNETVVVVPADAETVRMIFTRYLELGSVQALAQDLGRGLHPHQTAPTCQWPRHRRRRLRGRRSCVSAPQPVLPRRGGLSRRDFSRRSRADPRSRPVRGGGSEKLSAQAVERAGLPHPRLAGTVALPIAGSCSHGFQGPIRAPSSRSTLNALKLLAIPLRISS